MPRENDINREWRFNDIERKLNSIEGRLYELDSLRSDVARLERELRESRATCDDLRNEMYTLQESIREITEMRNER